MWLEGANIPEYLNGTWNNHAPKRKRKLLLHRLQITKLARGIEAKGYTIVPLSLYFKDGRVKAEIALARGKKEFDKRQALREEQDKREAPTRHALRQHAPLVPAPFAPSGGGAKSRMSTFVAIFAHDLTLSVAFCTPTLWNHLGNIPAQLTIRREEIQCL